MAERGANETEGKGTVVLLIVDIGPMGPTSMGLLATSRGYPTCGSGILDCEQSIPMAINKT